MTQTMPGSSEELVELFTRHGIDKQFFFEQPSQVIELLLANGDEALETDDFQLAEHSYFDALQLAQKTRLLGLEASIKNALSGVMDMQGKQIEALHFVEEALGMYATLQDYRGQAVCLCNLGGIQATLGQFDVALDTLRSGLEVAKSIDDTRLVMNILLNIGLNCVEAGLFENSLLYYREARELAILKNDHDIHANCLVNECFALLSLPIERHSMDIFEQALKVSRQHNLTNLEIEALNNFGCYYEQIDNWDDALRYYQQAHQFAQNIEYADGQLNAVLNLGKVNIGHGDPLRAAEQLHEALRLATQLDRPKSRRDAHQHLARLYKQAGQLDLALQNFEAFHAEEQGLSSTERDKTTRTLMMQFDMERAQTQTRAEREQREHAETLQARAEEQVRERTAELEQTQMEVVGRLAMAAEFRDDATGEHTRRVGIGAALIAESLGLSREFIETLEIAARLHDVGKIGIPDAVLLKESKLSVVEFEEMKRHTLIGGRLLSGGKSEVLNMARQIALTHHERWDGNGYPYGLTGQEIPLVGRIVALADVFDALMHKRPYKAAWEKVDVLAELARQRGRHFDPELTDAALLMFSSGQYEAALLQDSQVASVSTSSEITPADVASYQGALHWELEATRLQYEQLLESRTRELEIARYQAEVQVEQLRRAAFTDVMTDLHNRRAFETDLLVFAEQAQHHGRPLGIISLDLDNLKHVNDVGGHASGDALIILVAQQLQQHFEPSGRVYRMGGDEYVVLLWSDPEQVSRELVGEIGRLETELERRGHSATLSAGYAHWPDDVAQPEHLLRVSDERMYEQKRRRKLRPASLPVTPSTVLG
ncbi:HD domain-containing phosphohydrolase [Deinococcus altitudinis]|uniref:HD domain-containing phosphohydrolase n=1 Tax=Deinococcus altitudinis TaxID=468914 RepID=UPI003892201B